MFVAYLVSKQVLPDQTILVLHSGHIRIFFKGAKPCFGQKMKISSLFFFLEI